jgi:poly(hydroxyalkanoate) depolymerase family esterase
MNHPAQQAMNEATRLTQSGRLIEATALLRRALRGDLRPADRMEAHAAPILDLVAETIETKPPAHPTGGTFSVGTYAGAAGRRDYKLYVPSSHQAQALPLVVMLHGCTQSPDDFAAGTRMNTLAEEQGCFVVYPVQSASANASKCWNWFKTGDQQRDRGEPALIAGITRQVMHDYAIDSRRVYVAGLSAGGAAAAIMGATYPDLYAAIGVHSGLACGAAGDLATAIAAMQSGRAPATQPPGYLHLQRRMPAIVFHGDSDTSVNPRNGDQVVAQLQAAAAGELRTQVERGQMPGGHGFTRTLHIDANEHALLEQWVVHGAGHAWSGGSATGSYTDPRGPDASREMLRFFLENPRPAG